MAKVSSKWLSFLLAVMVVVAATGVNGQGGRSWQDEREHQGKGEGVFPPEGGRGGGGSWQDEREHEGKGEGVFPPEGGRGGGGGGGSYYPPAGGRGGGSGGGKRGPELREFILPMSKNVVETEAGVMRVVKGAQQNSVTDSEMHFGFITMEPNTMFIPQYLDSSIILFVERGTVRIGSIYNDKLVEKDLKAGDLYRIQGGSTFYLVNTAQGQRLHIIASIDTQGSTDWHSYEPFFIGGGTKPKSVLAGFNTQTIATALNVSYDVVDELFSSQQQGAIVRLNPDGESQKEPSKWKRFLEQGTRERKTHMQRIKPVHYEAEENSKWSFNNLFNSIFRNKKGSTDDDLEPYNIYGQEASFRNEYGWSLEVTGNDYKPLKYSDFGVYLVNLTGGSMMAPHVNPSAREFGIVLSGSGRIEVVYPNGTLAMDAEVNEGDMFWIPRYYPVCQMASRTSPFVIFGFTTSARKNMPQFLVGQGSVMQNMVSTEFAASFGMSEDQLAKIVNAQRLSTILPSASASPGGGEEIPETIESKIGMKKTSFAYNMAMELVD